MDGMSLKGFRGEYDLVELIADEALERFRGVYDLQIQKNSIWMVWF